MFPGCDGVWKESVWVDKEEETSEHPLQVRSCVLKTVLSKNIHGGEQPLRKRLLFLARKFSVHERGHGSEWCWWGHEVGSTPGCYLVGQERCQLPVPGACPGAFTHVRVLPPGDTGMTVGGS